jgi:uncharacterized protein
MDFQPVRQPKIYALDTGFVNFARGWDTLRAEACGLLWEHLPEASIRYWRDKRGHELDFVFPRTRDTIDVRACKWNPTAFDPAALGLFRSAYPRGRNLLVTPLHGPAYVKGFGRLEVSICEPSGVPA